MPAMGTGAPLAEPVGFAMAAPPPAQMVTPIADIQEPSPDPREWLSFLGVIWLMGTAVWFLRAAWHAWRFNRLLRIAKPAPADLQALAQQIAQRIGIVRCPAVWLVPGPLPPMVWAVGCPVRIFFPAGLLPRLGLSEKTSLLAHELAHVWRRDHWVRWIEAIVAGLYWWYPLVWLARRQLQAREEECCDAWAVGEAPAKTYASAVLEAVDFLAENRRRLPALASGLGGLRLLKQRLRLIMGPAAPKRLSWPTRLAVFGLGIGLLPLLPTAAQPAAPPDTYELELVQVEKPIEKVADQDPEPIDFTPTPVNLIGGNHDYFSVTLSRTGKWLAAGGGFWDAAGDVRLYDLTARKLRWTFTEKLGIASVAISPDSEWVATAGWERIAKVRNLKTGQVKVRFTLDSVARLAYSPNGNVLASASEGKTVKLWNARDGKEIANLKGELFRFHCVTFSKDGKTVAAGGGNWDKENDSQVTLWNVESQKQVGRLRTTRPVLAVTYSPDGKQIATGDLSGKILLWDAGTMRLRSSIQASNNWVEGLAFGPGDTLYSSGHDAAVRSWDLKTMSPLGTVGEHPGVVRSIALTPDKKSLITGGGPRALRMYDLASREEVAAFRAAESIPDPRPAALGMAVSPDRKKVAIPNDKGVVHLRDAASGEILHTLHAHEEAATAVAFSPNGQTLATASPDRLIKLWNVDTGKLLRVIKGHTSWVYALAFRRDGKMLASGGYDRSVRLWDPATGETRGTLAGHTAAIRALAFSPDGLVLASGGADKSVRLWYPTTGKNKAVLAKHKAGVRAIVFAPDGATVASADADGIVLLWDPDKRVARHLLKAHTGDAVALAYSPVGTVLATGE
jgi:WD40 repeat protein/beta-lactamase regulating signal transducer with metallopeptidase domain